MARSPLAAALRVLEPHPVGAPGDRGGEHTAPDPPTLAHCTPATPSVHSPARTPCVPDPLGLSHALVRRVTRLLPGCRCAGGCARSALGSSRERAARGASSALLHSLRARCRLWAAAGRPDQRLFAMQCQVGRNGRRWKSQRKACPPDPHATPPPACPCFWMCFVRERPLGSVLFARFVGFCSTAPCSAE